MMIKFSVAVSLLVLSMPSFGEVIESCTVAMESQSGGKCIDLEIVTSPGLDVVSNDKFVLSVERVIQAQGYIVAIANGAPTGGKAYVKLVFDDFQLSQDLPSGKVTGFCSSSATVKIEGKVFFASPADYQDTSPVDVTQVKGISMFKQRFFTNCGKKAAGAIVTVLEKELIN